MKQPTHIIILKIIFGIFFASFITFMIMAIICDHNGGDANNLKMWFWLIGMISFFVSLFLFFCAFKPELYELSFQKKLYFQEKKDAIKSDLHAKEAGVHYKPTKKQFKSKYIKILRRLLLYSLLFGLFSVILTVIDIRAGLNGTLPLSIFIDLVFFGFILVQLSNFSEVVTRIMELKKNLYVQYRTEQMQSNFHTKEDIYHIKSIYEEFDDEEFDDEEFDDEEFDDEEFDDEEFDD